MYWHSIVASPVAGFPPPQTPILVPWILLNGHARGRLPRMADRPAFGVVVAVAAGCNFESGSRCHSLQRRLAAAQTAVCLKRPTEPLRSRQVLLWDIAGPVFSTACFHVPTETSLVRSKALW